MKTAIITKITSQMYMFSKYKHEPEYVGAKWRDFVSLRCLFAFFLYKASLTK